MTGNQPCHVYGTSDSTSHELVLTAVVGEVQVDDALSSRDTHIGRMSTFRVLLVIYLGPAKEQAGRHNKKHGTKIENNAYRASTSDESMLKYNAGNHHRLDASDATQATGSVGVSVPFGDSPPIFRGEM